MLKLRDLIVLGSYASLKSLTTPEQLVQNFLDTEINKLLWKVLKKLKGKDCHICERFYNEILFYLL